MERRSKYSGCFKVLQRIIESAYFETFDNYRVTFSADIFTLTNLYIKMNKAILVYVVKAG